MSVTEDWKAISDQDKTEKLLLPSEFINQPDFHCVIKVSGHGISEGVIAKTFYDPVCAHFLDRYADEPGPAIPPPELTLPPPETSMPSPWHIIPTAVPAGPAPETARLVCPAPVTPRPPVDLPRI